VTLIFKLVTDNTERRTSWPVLSIAIALGGRFATQTSPGLMLEICFTKRHPRMAVYAPVGVRFYWLAFNPNPASKELTGLDQTGGRVPTVQSLPYVLIF